MSAEKQQHREKGGGERGRRRERRRKKKGKTDRHAHGHRGSLGDAEREARSLFCSFDLLLFFGGPGAEVRVSPAPPLEPPRGFVHRTLGSLLFADFRV